ncbi:Catalase-related peroxidase [Fusarium oxysporum f. sp. albedinis]|nr:Catalase-related peroxidase [Fusarium oxysporum f. sp. albedinis]
MPKTTSYCSWERIHQVMSDEGVARMHGCGVQGRPLISTMQAMGCNRQSSMACRILRSAKQNQLKNHFDRAPRRDSKVNPVVKKQKEKQAIENLQI